MSGSPPPTDAPSVAEQQAAASPVALAPPAAGADLCGFALPGFAFNLTFRLPDPLGAIDFPPSFGFAVGLRCDVDNPFEIVPGGGRQGTLGLTDDPEFGPDG